MTSGTNAPGAERLSARNASAPVCVDPASTSLDAGRVSPPIERGAPCAVARTADAPLVAVRVSLAKPVLPAVASERDGFWTSVRKGGPDDCWHWKGPQTEEGYGRFCVKRSRYRAHRVAWALHHNREPDLHLVVCHACDNPPCCNPAHLWLGTPLENNTDKVVKGRNGYGLQLGAKNPATKISAADALAIFNDPRGYKRIAKDYPITRTAVRAIKAGRTWKHVTHASERKAA